MDGNKVVCASCNGVLAPRESLTKKAPDTSTPEYVEDVMVSYTVLTFAGMVEESRTVCCRKLRADAIERPKCKRLLAIPLDTMAPILCGFCKTQITSVRCVTVKPETEDNTVLNPDDKEFVDTLKGASDVLKKTVRTGVSPFDKETEERVVKMLHKEKIPAPMPKGSLEHHKKGADALSDAIKSKSAILSVEDGFPARPNREAWEKTELVGTGFMQMFDLFYGWIHQIETAVIEQAHIVADA